MTQIGVRWKTVRWLGELGNELHRGRARADDRDPHAVQVGGVVPACRVQHGAGEGLDARDVRVPGLGEEARRGDEVRRAPAFPAADPDLPLLCGLIPDRPLDDGAEALAEEARKVAK